MCLSFLTVNINTFIRFEAIRKDGNADSSFYHRLFNIFASFQRYDLIDDYFSQMKKRAPSLVTGYTYQILLSEISNFRYHFSPKFIYSDYSQRNNEFELILKYYEEMKQSNKYSNEEKVNADEIVLFSYAKYCSYDQFYAFFNSLSERNHPLTATTYNTLLYSCVKNGKKEATESVLSEMTKRKYLTDKVAAIILKPILENFDTEESNSPHRKNVFAKSIASFLEMREKGFITSSIMFRYLILRSIDIRELEIAWYLLELVHKDNCTLPIRAYYQIIGRLIAVQGIEMVVKLLVFMAKKEIIRKVRGDTLCKILNWYGNLRLVKQMLQVFESFEAEKLIDQYSTREVYQACIFHSAIHGYFDTAISLFNSLLQKKAAASPTVAHIFSPDPYIYDVLMQQAVQNEKRDTLIRLITQVSQLPVQASDEAVIIPLKRNAIAHLIHYYVNREEPEDAWKVYTSTEPSTRDVLLGSMSPVLSYRLFQLFHEFEMDDKLTILCQDLRSQLNRKSQKTGGNYIALMLGYGKLKLIDKMEDTFNEMLETIPPSKMAFDTLIKELITNNQFTRVAKYVSLMSKYEFSPDQALLAQLTNFTKQSRMQQIQQQLNSNKENNEVDIE